MLLGKIADNMTLKKHSPSGTKKAILVVLLISILSIIFLALIKVLWCYFPKRHLLDSISTQTDISTARQEEDIRGWRVYTNIKHNYTFKFPTSFDYYPSPVPESEYSKLDQISVFGLSQKNGPTSGVIITILATDDNKSGWFYCSNEKTCLKERIAYLSLQSEDIQYSSANILGEARAGFIYRTENKLYFQESENFSFVEAGKTWTISITTTNIDMKDVSSLTRQIVSTLSTLN